MGSNPGYLLKYFLLYKRPLPLLLVKLCAIAKYKIFANLIEKDSKGKFFLAFIVSEVRPNFEDIFLSIVNT